MNLPTVEGGKVEAYADYEQIIDTDGTIYQPLEDKTVSVELYTFFHGRSICSRL